MKHISLISIFALCMFCKSAFADCVYGAKYKTNYEIIDSHTIILKGGYGNDILIKTYAFIYATSSIKVLKDSFCSYESSVLYVDSEVADVNEVKRI